MREIEREREKERERERARERGRERERPGLDVEQDFKSKEGRKQTPS